MTKQFTILQLFSLTDGRMSTNIDDIYDMLNHICDTELMTHHLPVAFNYLKLKNPIWFKEQSRIIKTFVEKGNTFEETIAWLKEENLTLAVPQLKDEFDTSDFGAYMVNNSLLLK